MDELATLLNVSKELLLEIEIPGIEFEIQTNVLWLHDACGTFDLNFLTLVVQAFIQKWRPDYIFSVTWATTCTKPLVGEFGGGWVIVTKDKIQTGNTWTEINKAMIAIKYEREIGEKITEE